MELHAAGVVDDPSDRRWKVGEDPYVIAEALEAGAHWLVSDNLSTLKPGVMELWLDKAQAEGRYMQAPRPFILLPDQAVHKMIEQSVQWKRTVHPSVRRAVIHAVGAPRDPGRSVDGRLVIFERFARELQDCGMPITGEETEHWAHKMRAEIVAGNAARVEREFATLTNLVPIERVSRTREAEERRMHEEGLVNRAQTQRTTQAHAPSRGPTSGTVNQ